MQKVFRVISIFPSRKRIKMEIFGHFLWQNKKSNYNDEKQKKITAAFPANEQKLFPTTIWKFFHYVGNFDEM